MSKTDYDELIRDCEFIKSELNFVKDDYKGERSKFDSAKEGILLANSLCKKLRELKRMTAISKTIKLGV